jgi:hypothetical protein
MSDLLYVHGSQTSREAAESMADQRATLRQLVYRYIYNRKLYGATDEEAQLALGMNPSTQRPRRIELRDRYNLVRDSGDWRYTKSGRRAVVWVAVELVPKEVDE